MMGGMSYDVIIVGGGHNGLVAAGYLARAGRRVLVLERRHTVGGAAVSEQPFGPDFTVTSLSYVVSLLPPDMVRDLRLAEHGYHVYPQGPYFAPRRDGRYLRLPADPARRHEEIAKFCATNYKVTFPMLAKCSIKGLTAVPLFKYLVSQSGDKKDVGWNFEKFLVNRKGEVVGRYLSAVDPSSDELAKAIAAELEKK